MKLVLFDIDGTLITDDGAARSAFTGALREVYAHDEPLDRYDFSGRTDPQIARMILEDSGWTTAEVDARFSELWNSYLGQLARNAQGSVRTLPGVVPLLDALLREPRVTLGLLTGNIEPGARIKLTPPDLNGYFSFGAFGSDSAVREELPPVARDRAEKLTGRTFEPENVVIIGDSIYDVRCGVPHSATTIAVASGKTSADRLRSENPTFFFKSLEDRDRVLEAVLGWVLRFEPFHS